MNKKTLTTGFFILVIGLVAEATKSNCVLEAKENIKDQAKEFRENERTYLTNNKTKEILHEITIDDLTITNEELNN